MPDRLRASIVGTVRVMVNQFSSIIQIGDTAVVSPRSRVLAVQRQVSTYNGDEGDLTQWAAFAIPIPAIASESSPIVPDDRGKASSPIQVESVEILGISVSGVLHIGSTKVIDSENRTLHIRQLTKGVRPVARQPAVPFPAVRMESGEEVTH